MKKTIRGVIGGQDSSDPAIALMSRMADGFWEIAQKLIEEDEAPAVAIIPALLGVAQQLAMDIKMPKQTADMFRAYADLLDAGLDSRHDTAGSA